MIRAVIFDLDNTLYDEDQYFLKVFEEFSLKNSLDFALFREVFDADFRLSTKDIFTDILKKLDIYSSDKQIQLFEIYKNIDCRLELYRDAIDVFNYLKNKNIDIAVLTNGVVDAQRNKVKSLGIEKLVKKIIYAREFGKEFEKPSEKPFFETVKILGVDKSEVVFVGDHPHTDILGANNFGIEALRIMNGYASKIECRHDNNIDSLLEIKKYLGDGG